MSFKQFVEAKSFKAGIEAGMKKTSKSKDFESGIIAGMKKTGGEKNAIALSKAGIKHVKGRFKDERVYTFKDGSSAIVRTDNSNSRIEYYNKSLEYINTFVGAKALLSYAKDARI